VPAPTGAESAAFDAHAIDELGVPQPVLMENAGRSAAQVAQRLFPEGRVVGFVGAGNNGGDALVLLRTLAAWGREVRAVLVADRASPEPLVHGWDVPTVSDVELGEDQAAWDALLSSSALLIDGILGTGVQGPPRTRQAAAIERLNAASRPVLAIDIPSGVDSGTGQVPGAAARADVTVSFGAPKLGSLLHPGRARVGRQVSVEIAFPPMVGRSFTGQVVTPAWAQARLPQRGTDTHKNEVGRVLVVAGRPGMAGAAVLAARGALRAGAGLVQVCSAPTNREILQSAVPEAIYVDASDEHALSEALAQAGAVVVGPGLGTDTGAAELLERVLAAGPVPNVVDADALNLLAADVGALTAGAARRPMIVTPHLGEMARLTGRRSEDIASDRTAAARDGARSFGCAVLLKGAPSLVAGGAGPILVDTQGSSDLAVAGMGDVLAGVVGALLAQGLGTVDAGAVGLYLSGRAANLAGLGPSLTPPDVVERLPDALAERGEGASDVDLPFVVFDQDAVR
jgi:NAD(P)H-hydrate epimerase